ncbi:hypothetical protein CKO15_12415 [Halorhodospira abdelmalekii]|nr:hypothetical protein [Halorhodospira abdelmalekii]
MGERGTTGGSVGNADSDSIDDLAAAACVCEFEESFIGRVAVGLPRVALIAMRLDGVILFWNDAAARLYGYRCTQALSRNVLELIVPKERRVDVSRQLETAAVTGKLPLSGVFPMSHQSGRRLKVYADYTWVEHPEEGAMLFSFQIDLSDHHSVSGGDHRLLIAASPRPIAGEFGQDRSLFCRRNPWQGRGAARDGDESGDYPSWRSARP